MTAGRPAVEFVQVSKRFWRHATRSFLRHTLVSWMRRSEADFLYALRDVTFTLAPGESLALVGPNGAGKSTLLHLVAQTLYPDAGAVTVNGRVSALLELGSGFHPDLTGAENVFLNAAFHGLSKKQAHARFEAVVDFSGIREFIHEPLRTYSTGMAVRLAFAVAVHVDPEILIIDEALAVGDHAFQQKCIDKIREFQREGKTLLCVSHGTELLKRLCDRALWLEKGEVVMTGAAAEVIEAYQANGRAMAKV